MKTIDIVRAWKDEKYRAGLSAEQLRDLPANPAGILGLHDEDLEGVTGGGGRTWWVWTQGCCWTDDWATFGCCTSPPIPLPM
jgi:mersacidin/lichenicidin family type 2 lantibiotic